MSPHVPPNSPPHQMSKPQWLVLGAGAMGCLWAAYLARAGEDVTLLVRNMPDTGNYKQQHTVTLCPYRTDNRSTDTENTYTVHLTTAAMLAKSGQDIHRVIIATKVFDAEDAYNSIADNIAPDAWVGTVFNGLGVHENLAKRRPDIPLYAGVSTDGALLTAPFTVTHTGIGQTVFGLYPSETHGANSRTGDTWPFPTEFGLSTQAVDNITPFLWQKCLINCAINPLTALFECKNGELLSHATYRATFETIMTELAAFAQHMALEIDHATLAETIRQVADNTAANQSSMLKDVLHRRRTELEALNGYLLKLANENGYAMPINQDIYQQLQAKITL